MRAHMMGLRAITVGDTGRLRMVGFVRGVTVWMDLACSRGWRRDRPPVMSARLASEARVGSSDTAFQVNKWSNDPKFYPAFRL